MSMIGNTLKVLSANCQGLQNLSKRTDVLSYFKTKNPNILCLQDTHWTDNDRQNVKKLWGYDIFLNGMKSNARGVAILLNKNFEYEVVESNYDDEGNYLYVQLKIDNEFFNIVTIYGPNKDDPLFYTKVKSLLQNNTAYTIICGYFNLVLDPTKDTYNYKHINNPKARLSVLNLMKDLNLVDVYRCIHPDKNNFTWRKRNPLKQARLDYFLTSNSLLDLITDCQIRPGYRSDHSMIELNIQLNKFTLGKGVWKFNNSLLKNPDFLELINKAISDEILKYAIPIYSFDFIEKHPEALAFTIDDDLLLEVLFLRIRGETIKFASALKKRNNERERELEKDIEYIEMSPNLLKSNEKTLKDKKNRTGKS